MPGVSTASQPRCAGLLLAAGEGRRLGTPKALVCLQGRSLLERGLAVLRSGGCDPVLAVVGAGAERIRTGCRARHADDAPPTGPARPAELVDNPEWAQGMGSSLRAGLAALAGRAEAVVVALVDQPLVEPAAVARLRQAWTEQAAAVVVATYRGVPRNPVLLDVSVWELAAEAATGDRGARDLVRGRPDLVVEVACDDVGRPDDIDTPADLALVEQHLGGVRP